MRKAYTNGDIEPLCRATEFEGEAVAVRYGGHYGSAVSFGGVPPISLETVSIVFSDGTSRWAELPIGWRDWDDVHLMETLPMCRIESVDLP